MKRANTPNINNFKIMVLKKELNVMNRELNEIIKAINAMAYMNTQ